MRWSMNDYDKIAEWARNNDIWYLKIDIDIPEECILEAQQVYEEGYFVKHRDNQVPMGTMGNAFDVANAVLFLASDEAKYITGTKIIVDGGLTSVTP